MRIMKFIQNILETVKEKIGSQRRDISSISQEKDETMEYSLENAQKMCNELHRVSKLYHQVNKQYKHNEIILNELHRIGEQDNDWTGKLEKSIMTLSNAEDQRGGLQQRIKKYGNRIKYLEEYEEELPSVLQEMEEYERKQDFAKTDLTYLEGEKGELEYQKERLVRMEKVVRRITIAVIVAIGLCTLALAVLFTIYEKDVFVLSLLLFVAALFAVTWIYMFRRYVQYSIKKNAILLGKTVRLANKAKIKYVNTIRFLEYEYEKYGVKNEQMLRYRWDQYHDYMRDHASYKTATNLTADIFAEIEKLFKEKNISKIEFWMDHLEHIQNEDARTKYEQKLIQLKKEIKGSLQDIETMQEQMLEQLFEFKEQENNSQNKLITSMIEKCIEEIVIV